MRYTFIIIFIILCFNASSQGNWSLTGSKTRYGNGIAFSSKTHAQLNSFISASDSNIVQWGPDSSLWIRKSVTGPWRRIATTSELSSGRFVVLQDQIDSIQAGQIAIEGILVDGNISAANGTFSGSLSSGSISSGNGSMSGTFSTGGLDNYNTNLGSSFTTLSKVTKGYVDSSISAGGGPFLPLSGGTLTNSGQILSFKASVADAASYFSFNKSNGVRAGYIGFVGGTGTNSNQYINTETGGSLIFEMNGSAKYILDPGGNNTWIGSGTFSGSLSANSISAVTGNISGALTTGGLDNYNTNLGSSFTTLSKVTKGYVDSAIGAGGGSLWQLSGINISPKSSRGIFVVKNSPDTAISGVSTDGVAVSAKSSSAFREPLRVVQNGSYVLATFSNSSGVKFHFENNGNAKYADNLASQFQPRSLVDKNYVDSTAGNDIKNLFGTSISSSLQPNSKFRISDTGWASVFRANELRGDFVKTDSIHSDLNHTGFNSDVYLKRDFGIRHRINGSGTVSDLFRNSVDDTLYVGSVGSSHLSLMGSAIGFVHGSTGQFRIGLPSGRSGVIALDADVANGNAAFNDKINSASFTTSLMTLNQQDGGTVTAAIPTWNQNTTGNAATATNATQWVGNTYNSTILNTAPTNVLAHDGTNWRPTSTTGINAWLGGPFLPLSGGTLTNSGQILSFKASVADAASYFSFNKSNGVRAGYIGFVGGTGTNSNQYINTETGGSLIFEMNGSTKYILDPGGTNTWVGSGTFGGSVTATGFFQSSDASYKTILNRTVSKDSLDMVYYRWKPSAKKDTKAHYGYIAQEVQKKLPDAVQKDKDGKLTVNYLEVLVYKIAKLEARIKELENKLK